MPRDVCPLCGQVIETSDDQAAGLQASYKQKLAFETHMQKFCTGRKPEDSAPQARVVGGRGH